MAEGERTRTRERGPLPENIYERCLRGRKETAERQRVGPIVIKPADREVELSRQGRLCNWPHGRQGATPTPTRRRSEKSSRTDAYRS
jgi:hypothetical protein